MENVFGKVSVYWKCVLHLFSDEFYISYCALQVITWKPILPLHKRCLDISQQSIHLLCYTLQESHLSNCLMIVISCNM